MMSGRGPTPMGRAAAEKSTADTVSPEGSDSGYGSTGNTTEHSQDIADGVALPSGRFFERKVTKLRLFDKEINQLTQHRFHDLHELFERPLCDYLIKAKVNPSPISVKLKVLGESEATAKPWIVVLCSNAASKKIRQFFNQPQIKDLYQPSDTADSFQPSFKVFVCNRPPRPMAGTEIYSSFNESATMCGRIIKVGEAHQSRFATLGGVIKVVKPSGDVMLYGMTTGHILVQQPLEQDNFDLLESCDEEDDEDEGFYSGEEEYELDDPFEGYEEVQDSITKGEKSQTVSQRSQMGHLWPKIGCVFAASNTGTGKGHDLDWILIKFDRPEDCRPNLLESADLQNQVAGNSSLKENRKPTEDGSSRSVFLLSGTGGVKKGTLSTSLSFLMMGPAKAFTKTYTLVLPHGSVLSSGDCGSWVVDPSTREVYGHVVASDTMGDSYVVPLGATLRDMEEKLGAAVFLPTETDIQTWLAQHAKATTERVIAPIKSKKKKVAFNDSRTGKTELPGNFEKLTRHSSSLPSAIPAPPAAKPSIPIVDYCNSCNAKFEGTSEGVRDNLLRHVRTCSRHGEDAVPGTEKSTPQIPKDFTPKNWPKRSFVKIFKSSQQKTSGVMSTQQTSPVAQSIKSVYPSFREKSGTNPQQKDGGNVESSSDSKGKKPVGSTSSKKLAVTDLPTAADSLLKNKDNMKESHSKRQPSTSLVNKGSPARSSTLGGRVSGNFSPAPMASPVIPDRRRSAPVATPLSPFLPPLHHPPPSSLAHGHKIKSSSLLYLPHNIKSGQVSYEGYNFTKCDSKKTGQKETWAIAKMDPMPVSQVDLKAQIEKNRKKCRSALDEYNDKEMNGNKRKQVDNLIRERLKVDGHYGYEYELASIKRDSRRSKSKTLETLSMQVILKRQLVADFFHEPSTKPFTDSHTKLRSQIMDLTSGDDPGKLESYRGGSHGLDPGPSISSNTDRPGLGAFPVFPAQGQAFGYGLPHINDRLPPLDAAPYPLSLSNSPAQGHREPPHPPSVPPPNQELNSTGGRLEEVNDPLRKKKKTKKTKSPTTVDTQPKSREKHDYYSDSPSLSEPSLVFGSDRSWTKTDATPDTVISGESSEYPKERSRYRKGSEIIIHQKDDIERTPYAHGTERPASRDIRREEHRRSSLSPARRTRNVSPDWSHPRQHVDLDPEPYSRRDSLQPYPYRTLYRDDSLFEIEPAIGSLANRAARHRRSSLSPERPSPSRYFRDRSPPYDSKASVPTYRESGKHDREAESMREHERLEREMRQLEIYEDEARARKIRDMERFEERFERDNRDARLERIREVERRGSASTERHGSRSEARYDYDYLPRHRPDPWYYD